MATNNPDENLPGPFKNGSLTDPEDPGNTRPNRLNQQAPGEAGPGPIPNDQTRAIPVRPKPEPADPAPGQHSASPVYDPHGQTQGVPARSPAPEPGRALPGQPHPRSGRPTPPLHSEGSQLAPASAQGSGLSLWFRRNWWWGAVVIVLFGMMIAAGGYSGFLSGQAERRALAEAAAVNDLTQQVSLGFEDLQAGRYDVARQRFEFVLNQDPNFPGAADGLVQALLVLNATSTPSPPTATPTLTPTRDLRPVEELLAQALTQMKNSDWVGVIETLNGLRKEDPNYQVTRVDGYLYIALRYQGVNKILNQSDLEGGIYDLALAEQFGPLDTEALGTRNLARLYIIGSSFWEAMPEQAVYYFSQVAAAAPYLRDASGWTARERYRQSLVQYGDKLAASGNWCEAQVQYETALSMQDDAAIGEKAQEAAVTCSPPTDVPTTTDTATPTPTLTLTPSPTIPGATTAAPTTPVATTPAPTTAEPTTPAPTTPVPTTAEPTTPAATTPVPTTEVPPPVETTPAPPPDTPTPTDTTAPPPVEPPTATAPASVQDTPTETPTETSPAPPAEANTPPAPGQALVGRQPDGERTFYA